MTSKKLTRRGDTRVITKGRIYSVTLLLILSLVSMFVTYVMYDYTQELLHERLKERIHAITSTAVLYFNEEEINKLSNLVNNNGRSSIQNQYYDYINKKLNDIRNTNEDIEYVYIWGETYNPNEVIWLADADVTSDLILEEGDGGNDFPGETYDITDLIVVQNEAFTYAVVEDELNEDEWGVTISSYAPLGNQNGGRAKAILGIDINVEDYITLVNATFLPFILSTVGLLLALVVLAYFLVKTWSKRAEMYRDLDKQKDELLGIVSHQLATPISSAKWYLEMLYEGDIGKLTKEQKEHVKTIQGIANTLTDLVGMILDVSRIQLGRMQVDRSEVNIDELFKEIIDVIRPKAEERKINFVVDIKGKLPIAMLDRRLTRMTLENLLSNAVKYTPQKGEVIFKCSVKDNNISYSVKDTGCGIPKNEQSKMFKKLYRATNAQKIKGNGFGLYVAKGAAEAQGGNIRFDSEENRGTTFYVDLPLLQ